jgi:predicted DNA binding CopG/RHH family protein
MVNKKVKNSSKNKVVLVSTPVSVEESPALEAAIAVAEPVIAKKTTRAKKAAKTPVVEQPVVEPTPNETAKEQTADKNVKLKRLTLDIAKPLHKAIKAKAVEEGVPMADMLRSLLEKHYDTP